MSKYTMTKVQDNGCTFYAIYNSEEMKYFAGYSFMGSADWESNLNDSYWMGDDEAYQIMADLEAADDHSETEANQADPQIESLQKSLDVYRLRRNAAWDAYQHYQKKDKYDIGGLDNAYRAYEKEQAFYEGFMAAVFAAGYDVQTQVGTDECIITK